MIPARLRKIGLISAAAVPLSLQVSIVALASEMPTSKAERSEDSIENFRADFSSRVVGVLGSGPQIRVRVVNGRGEASRELRLGDQFSDGWVLRDLNPSMATFEKAGATRTVGLTLDGAVQQAATSNEPPTAISVWPDAMDRAVAAGDVMAVIAGNSTAAQRWAARRVSALGSANPNDVRLLDGLLPLGPDLFYVQPGQNIYEAARQAGLQGLTGYTVGNPDQTGRITVTKIMTPAF